MVLMSLLDVVVASWLPAGRDSCSMGRMSVAVLIWMSISRTGFLIMALREGMAALKKMSRDVLWNCMVDGFNVVDPTANCKDADD